MPKINIPDYLKNLTKSPGVYKFLDKSGNVIYVGKAKNLRNRVRSYFNSKHSDEKTKSLVSNIDDISIILVETESDALLLENNLIKKFKPKNVLIHDAARPNFTIKLLKNLVKSLKNNKAVIPSIHSKDSIKYKIKNQPLLVFILTVRLHLLRAS